MLMKLQADWQKPFKSIFNARVQSNNNIESIKAEC
jgi:hypothetical protein